MLVGCQQTNLLFEVRLDPVQYLESGLGNLTRCQQPQKSCHFPRESPLTHRLFEARKWPNIILGLWGPSMFIPSDRRQLSTPTWANLQFQRRIGSLPGESGFLISHRQSVLWCDTKGESSPPLLKQEYLHLLIYNSNCLQRSCIWFKWSQRTKKSQTQRIFFLSFNSLL